MRPEISVYVPVQAVNTVLGLEKCKFLNYLGNLIAACKNKIITMLLFFFFVNLTSGNRYIMSKMNKKEGQIGKEK